MNVLLLADTSHPAAAVTDHICAIHKGSRHRYYTLNPIRQITPPEAFFKCFDVIIIHYSLYVISDYFLPDGYRKAISASKALKIQFVQDEYREVYRLSESIADLGIDILYTLFTLDRAREVYDHPRLKKLKLRKTLTGYMPENLSPENKVDIKSRRIDIGYRARPLPFWLGRLGQEKKWIAQKVIDRAERFGLKIDVSWKEEDRVYGGEWIKLLKNSRATLVTESGSSITDKSGEVKKLVEEYVALNLGVEFEEVNREILHKYEGNIPYNCCSPRIFEAAALFTPMIAFPGDYEGVIAEGRNYIRLEKDFSNFQEVADLLRDDDYLQQLSDRTHNDLIASGKYNPSVLAQDVDLTIDAHAEEMFSITGYNKESDRGKLMPVAARYYLHVLLNRAEYVLSVSRVQITILATRAMALILFWYPIAEIRQLIRLLKEDAPRLQKVRKIIKKTIKYVKINKAYSIGRITAFIIPLIAGLYVSIAMHAWAGISILLTYITIVYALTVGSEKLRAK